VFWELTIVTVGVLVALAAQQWAEAHSQRGKAGSARKAIQNEVADHHFQAVEWRIVTPCIDAQLNALDQRLLSGENRLSPAPTFSEGNDDPYTYVLRTPNRPYVDSVWQATNGEGVSSFLRPAERLQLGSHYGQAKRANNQNEDISELASRLLMLSMPIDLDPSARVALLQQTAAIRGYNRAMNIRAGQLIGNLTNVRLGAPRQKIIKFVATSGTIRFCRSQNLPMLPLDKAMLPMP
jgi:hypothetical protein